jgi:hypothetical protein
MALWSTLFLHAEQGLDAKEEALCTNPWQQEAHDITVSLALHDTKGACLQLERLREPTEGFVNDPEIFALALEYLAQVQDTASMKILWDKASERGQVILPRETIEHIAWSLIESSSTAYHPLVRAESLLAAAASQDARGMHILHHLLNDQHQGVQQMALELAMHYPDESIQRRVEEIARTGLPDAKVAAAHVLAQQKAPHAAATLHSMLYDESLSEDDLLEVAALTARLNTTVDPAWVRQTVTDPNPALRALAASSVLSCPSKEGLLLLLPLLADTTTIVKKSAFQALGLWQALIPEAREALIQAWRQALPSPSTDLAAIAAWALLLSYDNEAQHDATAWFDQAIASPSQGKALIATSRLVSSGTAGLCIAQALLSKIQEPYVVINLASYLLLHRSHGPEAAEALQQTLSSQMLGEHADGLFSWIGPSLLIHHPAIPRLPESQDLLIRLQLLALRRYANQPVSRDEVEHMLSDRAFGVSAQAASFVFQEFACSLDEVLSPLLTHETEAVRIQAALLLTLISKSQRAAMALADQYEKASRAGKESIILGFGVLPIDKTQPYLVPLLFDASPVLRTRAAGALVTSLYR